MRYRIYKTQKGYMLYDSKCHKLLVMEFSKYMGLNKYFKSIKYAFDNLNDSEAFFTPVYYPRAEFPEKYGTPFIELDILDYDYLVQNYPHLLII